MPAKKTTGPATRSRTKTSKPNVARRRSAPVVNVPVSASRKGDDIETRFAIPLADAGYYGFTVEHVFPIGVDPDMHSYNYIVVGMNKGRSPGKPPIFGDYATWYGVDWSHHPNPSNRSRGCVIMEGHYDMTEEEAFQDALDRVQHERRRRFTPIPDESPRPRRRR